MDKNKEFKTIYNNYGEMLYRIAYVYLANPDDAEDVLQDVFISFLENLKKFKSDEHKKAWLIRATQNKCINLLKASSRKQINIEDIQLQSFESNDELHIDILKQIIALDEKYKTVVILYYYNDYSVSEIAQILKISKSAVKMRLKRSRELLKIKLEDYENE